MDKNKEILNKQKRQNELKNELKKSKKNIPSFIIGFIFFATISFYFLEDKFYLYFGNSVSFVRVIIIFLGLFSLFFGIKGYIKIRQKENEVKSIGSQLYKLLKLDEETKDE